MYNRHILYYVRFICFMGQQIMECNKNHFARIFALSAYIMLLLAG